MNVILRDYAADYDAFIMAAAVANLIPSDPYDGKFPSHKYKVGEQFDIRFEIAPRAIDIIKQINPRAALVGYKLFDGPEEELIEAARITLRESKANIIFANTPEDAKDRKFAVMQDNTVLPCSFDEHLTLIDRLIDAEYFRTIIEPMTEDEANSVNIRKVLNIVKMYEKSMNGFGTVAVPIPNVKNMLFATTARGHNGDPVIVRSVDFDEHTITATAKATLNAPALAAALDLMTEDSVIVHRHFDDPNFDRKTPFDAIMDRYLFPGTAEEAEAVAAGICEGDRVKLVGHGDIAVRRIADVCWDKYYEQFPDRYFSIPDAMQEFIDKYNLPDAETLEVGGNRQVCTKYAYDPYVPAENAINLTKVQLAAMERDSFDLTVCKNAVNYLDANELRNILRISKHFVANTFLTAPDEKITDREAAISSGDFIIHTLRLDNDDLVQHLFWIRSRWFYESFGLKVTPYGKNSALLTK